MDGGYPQFAGDRVSISARQWRERQPDIWQGGDPSAQDCNHNGESASSLCHPQGVAVDPRDGDLYVADSGNNRVLLFHDPSGGNASAVLGTCGGYDGFGCGAPNPTAATLLAPSGITVDGARATFMWPISVTTACCNSTIRP
jgi:hypothetical protein